MAIVWRFWNDRRGATAIEYALIGTLISIVIIVSATSIGASLNAKLQKVSSGLT